MDDREHDDDDDDAEWESWAEPEEARTVDLFDAARVFDSAAECLAHVRSAHGLDLAAVASNRTAIISKPRPGHTYTPLQPLHRC